MEISIVIPCRNEGKNVETIASRIAKALPPDILYEIVFVDDSDDETTTLLQRLSENNPNIRYLHRVDRTGLGTAILDGFHLALGEWFIVMDADLQHPPESLSLVIEEIHRDAADIIIPSRFIPGGSDGGLNVWRKLVSWTARMLGRILLHRVRRVTDPTSGYFAVRRTTAFSNSLDPIGWKLLLELLVRSEYEEVREIPYAFQARDLGSSKFNMREQWYYIRHLFRLVRASEMDSRFWKFCLVGLSGVVINTAVYIPLVKLNMTVLFAYACATLTAMLSNFVWNNLLTWTHLKRDRMWYRMTKFALVSLGGLGVSSLVVLLAHDYAGIHYLLAGFLGIVVSTGWNFIMHNIWTFGTKTSQSDSMTTSR